MPSRPEGMMEYLYRYHATKYAPPLNEWDEPSGEGRVEVLLFVYPVIRRTPKGAWINFYGEHKYVRLVDVRKRFACPTIEEAAESFDARKRAQIRILGAQLRDAERALKAPKPQSGMYTSLLFWAC